MALAIYPVLEVRTRNFPGRRPITETRLCIETNWDMMRGSVLFRWETRRMNFDVAVRGYHSCFLPCINAKIGSGPVVSMGNFLAERVNASTDEQTKETYRM